MRLQFSLTVLQTNHFNLYFFRDFSYLDENHTENGTFMLEVSKHIISNEIIPVVL